MTAPARTDAPLGTSGPARPASWQVQAEVQDFYARQMRLLDEGRAEEWAETFTEDGVFTQNVKPEPWRGRAEIAARMRVGLDRLAARPVTRRHWLGMLIVDEGEEPGTWRCRFYALVFEIPDGGDPRPHLSAPGEDLLVRGEDGRLRIRHRLVEHDGAV
ncbi:nuclear transport factor 2 family protein [Streptomyces filamentosus]|uniref:nuclear transport factor 2 family protein n=1 Tax=Streptomyces filamentosus TaxID=67294 RepID=UPI0038179814